MEIPIELDGEQLVNLDLSALNSGMYFISIAMGDQLITKKFVKPN